MDGGSIYLNATDAEGKELSFYLNWSIDAQRKAQTSWSVNGNPIPPGSPEESQWLDRIRNATIVSKDRPPTEEKPPVPKRLILLPPGDAAYIEAIDQGPQSALQALTNRLIENITSDQHQNRQP